MKKILLFLAILAISITPAFAWHCADTDQAQPDWNNTAGEYGTWGDNDALGGTTYGWYDIGVTLPEGCELDPNNRYKGSCEDLCVDFTLREFVCEDRPNYPGESVITWIDRSDSPECGGDEVPEFSPLAGAGIIAAAGIMFFVYRRKNN